ncbi:hypothetical protein ESCO_004967 [Escovopsis weberi]|uniref:Carboxymuconolactone decarboxylase-like domain-containing protein n=1 Tax=Escovopsis weberi TaxID=150374 RepID=A0A0M9VVV7_ESCWE|nr:hypothetical protein ESCO_004967 [Escovopsis weberi]
MRLPYVSDPPPTACAEDEAIVQRTRDRRAPRPLQPLDLTLLHSTPITDGWNSFIGAIRTRTSLDADVREIAISRVAFVNKAWYEWESHSPLVVEAGVDPSVLDILRQPEFPAKPDGLNAKQWAVLLYTDEMTRNVQVRDETFALLRCGL